MDSNLSLTRQIPPGIKLLRAIRGRDWTLRTYRYVILLVTFIAYACYHASRKPSSIVKSVLDPDPAKPLNVSIGNDPYPWPIGKVFITNEMTLSNVSKKGWEPFNGKDGTSKLGEIDVAFLACYSFGMYIAGHLGDKLDLRLFLTSGMVGSGIFVGLFGMGYFWNVHVFWFYLAMQMVAGLFQATGWPSVVAVIGNWFGKRKRGLIMGIWNAHTSVGNISGSLLAAAVLSYGWGWCFIVPGAFIVLGGILVFFFLAAYPEDIGFTYGQLMASDDKGQDVEDQNRSAPVAGGNDAYGSGLRTSVGLLEACSIPGVIPFALCLFFSKLVAYTFLYWLPFYLSQTGYISDRLKARAITAATFMYLAIPAMLLYRWYGSVSQSLNIVLMMIAGLFVNGPYALITTAVSADLGTHSSLRGDSRALATVTAIIDGTGSIGAALGPLLTGFLSTHGWNLVFVMLMLCALVAGLLLTRLVIAEIAEKPDRPMPGQPGQTAPGTEPLLGNRR